MIKVGVCLSGCGVNDGSEIHESVITLLALDRAGAEVICMAPDIDQLRVQNHYTGEDTEEVRNVLVESARIARGNITNLSKMKASDMDALIFPGGFGAALNLCDFGMKGSNSDIHPEVTRLIKEMLDAEKPIGVICIAPAMMARALKDTGVSPELTIGNDTGTAEEIESLGANHVDCAVDDIVMDHKNKIVSTPAYMLAENISDAASGIEKLVTAVLSLVHKEEPVLN